jgi:hypothetical protein
MNAVVTKRAARLASKESRDFVREHGSVRTWVTLILQGGGAWRAGRTRQGNMVGLGHHFAADGSIISEGALG